MHSPIFYQGYLFIANGMNVRVYNANGAKFEMIDYYPFTDPVLRIGRHYDNLLVETEHAEYLICGGPSAAEMYVLYFRNK